MANRKARRAATSAKETWFELIPYFEGQDGTLIAGMQTYIMHCHPKDIVVAAIPSEAISLELARGKEHELMVATGKDCIVTDKNVRLLRAREMSAAEVATRMPKGIPVERKPAPVAPPSSSQPVGPQP